MTLREKILGTDDRKRVTVPVPEWNETLYARPMNAKQQIAFHAAHAARGDNPSSAVLVAFCIEDADGNLVFQPEDIPAIAEKNAGAICRLANAATSLFESPDELRKNS
jgi:hypothetical protein